MAAEPDTNNMGGSVHRGPYSAHVMVRCTQGKYETNAYLTTRWRMQNTTVTNRLIGHLNILMSHVTYHDSICNKIRIKQIKFMFDGLGFGKMSGGMHVLSSAISVRIPRYDLKKIFT